MTNQEYDHLVEFHSVCYVLPTKQYKGKKYDIPAWQYASARRYGREWYHSKSGRAAHSRPVRRVGRDQEKVLANRRKHNKIYRDKVASCSVLTANQREYKSQYQRNRIATDTEYKLQRRLHKRMAKWFTESRKGWCTGHAYLGLPKGTTLCDWMTWHFKKGMTLDNHGYVWHIDHVYPVKACDPNDRLDVLAVQNYRNLRPVYKWDNLSKGAKVTEEARLLFQEIRKELDQ